MLSTIKFFDQKRILLKIFIVVLSKIYITLKLIIFKIMFFIIRIMVFKSFFVTIATAFLSLKVFVMYFMDDIFL